MLDYRLASCTLIRRHCLHCLNSSAAAATASTASRRHLCLTPPPRASQGLLKRLGVQRMLVQARRVALPMW